MSEKTPFDDLKPDDGFQVITHDLGRLEASLHVVLREDGELKYDTMLGPHVEVWSVRDPTTRDLGERERAKLVMEAICRYFNSGGSWEELDDMLQRVQPFMQGGLAMPGWHYHDGYIDTQNVPTDVFRKEGTPDLVRWVRGSHIERLTVEEFVAEMDEDEPANDPGGFRDVRGGRDPSETGEDGGGAYPALPGPEAEG